MKRLLTDYGQYTEEGLKVQKALEKKLQKIIAPLLRNYPQSEIESMFANTIAFQCVWVKLKGDSGLEQYSTKDGRFLWRKKRRKR